MPRRPIHERLICNLGVRLTLADHALLIAYAEARGLAWQVALREIVHEALRQENAPVRPGPRRVREKTPA